MGEHGVVRGEEVPGVGGVVVGLGVGEAVIRGLVLAVVAGVRGQLEAGHVARLHEGVH